MIKREDIDENVLISLDKRNENWQIVEDIKNDLVTQKENFDLVSDEITSLGDSFDSHKENFNTYKDEFDSHKLDYVNYQNSNNLKIATVEKELNDYKSTMASVNVNQEAKQSASGYGVVSLPKNAANGNVSVSTKGFTATNLINNGVDYSNWRVGGAGTTKSENGIHLVADGAYDHAEVPILNIKPNTLYTLIYTVKQTNLVGNLSIAGSVSAFPDTTLTQTLGQNKVLTTSKDALLGNLRLFLSSANTDGTYINFSDVMLLEGDWTDRGNVPYFDGTKSTQSASRLKSVSEDEKQESVMYLPNVGELRSLPNGTKDEIRVSSGNAEYVQRTKKYVLQDKNVIDILQYSNLDAISFSKPVDSYGYDNLSKTNWATLEGFPETLAGDSLGNENRMRLTASASNIVIYLPKGTTVEQAKAQLVGRTLTYQLAEPIVTPIEVSGTLLSNPSGTVYVEPVVADAGMYIDKLNVLNIDLPINYIEKLSKVDFNTGVETELDASQCVVAEDKLSFTHPDLTANDIVFFTYFHNKEGTQGETTIEYYDSRHTLKDSVTGKFYKIEQSVANGELVETLVEV